MPYHEYVMLRVAPNTVHADSFQGLYIILDNHTSDAIWCCTFEDGNGMWYTAKWPEQQWLRGWELMARRYANTTAVIGTGLRNEPRPALIGELEERDGCYGCYVKLAWAYLLGHLP
jgi:hypothetical protein